ncbi:MAG: type I DNA topoisomerase [bacterium]|jgi:DNA topoisomerase-1
MGKNLVIVESPAKAKTINKILGADYVVKASMGHIRDLPVKSLGVDPEKNFKPQYEVTPDRKKIVKELCDIAEGCDAVYLAPDPDREGEAIAWHLKALLKGKVADDQFFRVTYNEITPRAVREAFANPSEINEKLVNAQQARRILDRIVGYKVSPLLWSRIRRGLSAGRVQSVALRLVCEREMAIRAFIPEPFWLFGADVRKEVDPRDPFALRLARIKGAKADVKTPEQAETVRNELNGRQLRVKDIIRRELSKRTSPPYITSSLQQAGSRVFDFTPSRTMKIAQKLYEGMDLGDGPTGLITYMRTDSFNIAQDALNTCRTFIEQEYGQEYLPEKPNYFKSRGNAQEAHEAIRPTDVNRTPKNMSHILTPDELKLYTLVWQRFVASQMAPARIEQKTVEVETTGAMGDVPDYLFRATASQVAFPGYMKVSGVQKKVKEKDPSDKEDGAEEESEVDQLPNVERGELLEVLKWLEERKETQPPGRFSEASLIKALEENGVGRPSTYASILGTLYDRRYIAKEKKAISPTDIGLQVNGLLVQYLNELFEVKFTAGMELLLDEIEAGKVEWTDMLRNFYVNFVEWMKAAKGPAPDSAKVGRVLAVLEHIKEWGPEVKRGRRTYSDKKFADSIREQMEKAEKPLSMRQFESLGRIALRYREQIPGVEATITESGLGLLLEEKPDVPPEPSTVEKMSLLKGMEFDPPKARRGRTFDEKKFIDSLQRRVDQNRELSPAQLNVVNRMVLKYADRIPDFEVIKSRLVLEAQGPQVEDPECAALLDQLKTVTEWKEAVEKKGKTFDDKTFYVSLSRQYEQRKSLTPRQKSALKRMVKKYAPPVPEETAAE